jgi:hypothetical protein
MAEDVWGVTSHEFGHTRSMIRDLMNENTDGWMKDSTLLSIHWHRNTSIMENGLNPGICDWRLYTGYATHHDITGCRIQWNY